MNRLMGSSMVLLGVLLAAGCGKAPTTAQNQVDIAKAQREGAKDVAAAQQQADERMATANQDVSTAEREAAKTSAGETRNMTVAEAKAANEVALERCEAQTGDARADCRHVADTELDARKARAEATEAIRTPAP